MLYIGVTMTFMRWKSHLVVACSVTFLASISLPNPFNNLHYFVFTSSSKPFYSYFCKKEKLHVAIKRYSRGIQIWIHLRGYSRKTAISQSSIDIPWMIYNKFVRTTMRLFNALFLLIVFSLYGCWLFSFNFTTDIQSILLDFVIHFAIFTMWWQIDGRTNVLL